MLALQLLVIGPLEKLKGGGIKLTQTLAILRGTPHRGWLGLEEDILLCTRTFVRSVLVDVLC